MDSGSILVVDDDADITANFVDILTSQGYRADAANNGKSALEMVTRRKYDLALLDFQMPDMDGASLFEAIRSVRPELKAIMITAYAANNGVERAKKAGICRVLRKPVDMRLFFSALESITPNNNSEPV